MKFCPTDEVQIRITNYLSGSFNDIEDQLKQSIRSGLKITVNSPSQLMLTHYAIHTHFFFLLFSTKNSSRQTVAKKILPGIEKYSYDQSLAEQITAVHTGLTGH